MRASFGLVLTVLFCAVAIAADSPAPKMPEPASSRDKTLAKTASIDAIQSELEKLLQARSASTETLSDEAKNAIDRAKLRAKLFELIAKLETAKAPAKPMPAAKPSDAHTAAPPKFDLPDGTKPLDAVRLAENLFKVGEVDSANRAFKLIDLTKLSREERAFAQYMQACCQRRLGKSSEAAVIYREIADAKEDDFLAECAMWHLDNIRSTRELEAQLEQLRARRKSP